MKDANGGTEMLQPIEVEGDGSCLFHSVSRALFGQEIFNRVLRSLCVAEMQAHKAWYAQHLYFGSEDTVQEFLDLIRAPTSEAPTTTFVALAHVLRRPVVLLSSLADITPAGSDLWGTGVYLPARLAPEQCCPHPLLIAWGRSSHDHYVPLCRTTDSGKVLELPPQCRPAASFPQRTPELPGASVERYIPVHCWHLNDTRFSDLDPTSLLFPRPAGQQSAFNALYTKLFKKCLTDAKNLLRDVPTSEAEDLLLSPNFVNAAELAAEARPAWLSLAALVQYEAERVAHEVLVNQAMQTGVDALCIDAWVELKAGLPPQLVDSLAVAQLTQCELALRSAAGMYLSKGMLTQGSVLEILEVAAEMTDERNRICASMYLRNVLAGAIASIQADAAARAQAEADAAAAARAKAEADAKAAAEAREAEFHEVLLTALLNAQHRQPRWASSALARCAHIAHYALFPWHGCISCDALAPHSRSMQAAVAQMAQTQWAPADLAPCGLPATASAPARLLPQTEAAQRLGATMSDGPRLGGASLRPFAAGQRLGATKSAPAGDAAARGMQTARAELAQRLRRAPGFQNMPASASDEELIAALVRTVSGRRAAGSRPAVDDDAPRGKRLRLQEPLLEAVPPHEQVYSAAVGGGEDPAAAAAVDAIALAALGEADGDDLLPDAHR